MESLSCPSSSLLEGGGGRGRVEGARAFELRRGGGKLIGERNNEFPGLSLNPEDSFLIVGIVTHFVESHHQKLCTNTSHFDLLYLL